MSRRRRDSERGIVLIMALVVMAILTVISAAFIVVIRQESVAAQNGLNAEQARLAARAGISHAIRQIDAARKLYQADGALGSAWAIGPTGTRRAGSPANFGNPPYVKGAGWHGKFANPAGVVISDQNKWIDPYAGETYGLGTDKAGPGLRGKSFDLQSGIQTVGRYAVAVADLDGRLHVYPANFGAQGLNQGKAKDMLDTLLQSVGVTLTAPQLNNLAKNSDSPGTTIYSPGELAPEALVSDPTQRNRMDDLLTVYPVGDPENSDPKLTILRPAVNVNTARSALLGVLIARVLGFDGTPEQTAVVAAILRNRPFTGRRHLEAVIADLAPAPVGDGTLGEQQFNDLLNSLNDMDPSIFTDDGSFVTEASNTPVSSGIYKMDFDSVVIGAGLQTPPDPALAISQTGGAATETTNVTWSTELKFQSRFFHIYSVGMAIDSELKTRATRRAHAVYDAANRKILYYRNNLTDRANLGDL